MGLINDLQDLAASKTMAADEPLKATPLDPILHELVNHFAVEAEQKQIALHYEAAAEPVMVRATEHGLARIFSNLVSNAIKYTPSGGVVRISVQPIPPEAGTVCVQDSGIGIPADALPHIGEEFFRAENARQSKAVGTGLSLSTVQQMVNFYAGSLSVASTEGKGSTFKAVFRRAGQDSERKTPSELAISNG